jgi:hypothetical protein
LKVSWNGFLSFHPAGVDLPGVLIGLEPLPIMVLKAAGRSRFPNQIENAG